MSDETFDYVVIGSGAAGATAARVLVDTGASVALLEEGPEVAAEDFDDRVLPSFHRLYRGGGAQITRGRAPMLVLQARCVGGTTVVNSAIARRLPEEVWQEWARDHGLRSALPWVEIERASSLVETELSVAPTPRPVWGGNNRLLERGAQRAGVAGAPTRRNVSGCLGSARCNLGCPHGAKQSMQVTYLPYARERGANLLAGRRAERVLWRGSRAVGVAADGKAVGARRAVLVAASAVQTPGLLRRSGVRSRHLGRHFQAHPGMGVVGLFDEPVGLGQGATQGFEVDGFRADARVKIETLSVPPETFMAGLPGVGRRWVSLMAEFPHSALWVLPLRSRAEGSVDARDRVRFGLPADDLGHLRAGLRHAAELMFAAGAREVVCPVHGLPERIRPDQIGVIDHASDDPAAYPLAISHLFGTARMGTRPESGVVGGDFRVHGSDNLYVVDSSVFPTNLGVNPQVAIMALARIAAERLSA